MTALRAAVVNRIEKVESSWFRGKFNNLPKVNFMKLRFETGETAAVSKLLLNAEGNITDIKKISASFNSRYRPDSRLIHA